MSPPRRTLAAPARVEGLGLFTGSPCAVTFEPADAGAGLALATAGWNNPCPATIAHLSAAPVHPVFTQIPARCPSVGPHDTPPIATVEHALAALAGLGITDATLTVEGPEIPIDDGSALAFVDAIAAAGLRDLNGTIEPITPTQAITVERDGARITIEPADTVSYEYRLAFDDPANVPVSAQSAAWSGGPEDFAASIAPARTFSLAREAAQMQAMGLFTAFTPADLLVIDDAGNPIDNAWRFDTEPARHKLLDLVGDLALAGAPIRAKITAERSGHALNHEAARRLAQLL
ncbi:MAG: UDP-3-O-acyl-N-acetylglucosamine deacetylase [Phycisphaeraceae bacterium]|nr:MAG: UDP-3-O-acyl-N-acetylglucosamine deacetylase [Phycisphaeraceae bacterium]